MREKCSVLMPVVEGSVPLFEAGRSSARRNPVWMFVAEGAKIEASERVISTARVVVSNYNYKQGRMENEWEKLHK
jgi:hypothetical protein